jgi:hypothetical protein
MVCNISLCIHSSDGDNLSKGMCEKADGSEDDSTQYDECDKASVLPFHVNIALNESRAVRTVGKHDTVSTLLTVFFNIDMIFVKI